MFNELKAQMLLDRCVGNEIWPVDVCQAEGVPQAWIDELVDAFESGFDQDRHTIYLEGAAVNQFYGVPDLLIAYKLAEYIGIDTEAATSSALGKLAQVQALKEAAEEE